MPARIIVMRSVLFSFVLFRLVSGFAAATDTDPFDPKIGIATQFVPIELGIFQMGTPSIIDGSSDKDTPHLVRLTRAFEMQATELTQRQYLSVMGENPSFFGREQFCDKANAWKRRGRALCLNHPVERVSWDDVQEFIRRLNQMQDKYVYRLPTEAEWEYAARAGVPSRSQYSFGSEDEVDTHAWHYKNSQSRTHAVASKKPNPLGLYDMHGNVWEWVQDYWGKFPDRSVVDPQGPQTGSSRVCRGGAWSMFPGSMRHAIRLSRRPDERRNDLGFRLVRERR